MGTTWAKENIKPKEETTESESNFPSGNKLLQERSMSPLTHSNPFSPFYECTLLFFLSDARGFRSSSRSVYLLRCGLSFTLAILLTHYHLKWIHRIRSHSHFYTLYIQFNFCLAFSRLYKDSSRLLSSSHRLMQESRHITPQAISLLRIPTPASGRIPQKIILIFSVNGTQYQEIRRKNCSRISSTWREHLPSKHSNVTGM